MAWFTFSQNNAGGWKGPQYIIIEAANAEDANTRAREQDVYFDGVSEGIDCDCCGDRWHEALDSDGLISPLICGRSPDAYLAEWPWDDILLVPSEGVAILLSAPSQN